MKRVGFRLESEVPRAAATAVEVVEAAGLLLFPTESFYGLGADPDDEGSVARVFTAKGRPKRYALPVVCADWQQVETLVVVPDQYRVRLSRIWPGALTAVLRCRRPVAAAPLGTLGVRIPGHAMLRAVLYRTGPLTGTSANRHGQPPHTDPDEALASLVEEPDLVLDGGRSPGGDPSTVVDLTTPEPMVLRRGPTAWDEPFPWDDPQ